MHIPDNYLSPQTCAVMTAVCVPAWIISIRKVRGELPKEKVSMMGAAAALSFLGMMFNVPLPGGTTGHAVGGTLAAILLGPYAACISISTALLLQALIFGDGGILAFGANCFNMALVLPFVGYALYRLLTKGAAAGTSSSEASPMQGRENGTSEKRRILAAAVRKDGSGISEKRRLIAAGIASYVGINAAALCAAIEFGIQPLLFRDAADQPMYCPYDLSVSIPAMMAGHLSIFGLAEVVFTVLILAFCDKVGVSAAESVKTDVPGNAAMDDEKKGSRAVGILIACLIVFTPIGLLAEGTAWGEWGTDEIVEMAGYTPAGMTGGFEWSSLLPDYSVGNLPEWFGYILSAVIGAAALIIIFKLFSNGKKTGTEQTA
ncbi:MAG: energy-coupling factor ABC transporter permease [Lachnospiraceae bacterium]|jgi:cobalt/nickel transport system permease protein|nr:energy-coupling factor ABC transporter permease [Lachnospiraceae bacterium]